MKNTYIDVQIVSKKILIDVQTGKGTLDVLLHIIFARFYFNFTENTDYVTRKNEIFCRVVSLYKVGSFVYKQALCNLFHIYLLWHHQSHQQFVKRFQ